MATKKKAKNRAANPASLDDVVAALGDLTGELKLLKRLITKYMVYHGVTQEEVAAALGVSQGTVSPMIGGSGGKRLEHQHAKAEKSK